MEKLRENDLESMPLMNDTSASIISRVGQPSVVSELEIANPK